MVLVQSSFRVLLLPHPPQSIDLCMVEVEDGICEGARFCLLVDMFTTWRSRVLQSQRTNIPFGAVSNMKSPPTPCGIASWGPSSTAVTKIPEILLGQSIVQHVRVELLAAEVVEWRESTKSTRQAVRLRRPTRVADLVIGKRSIADAGGVGRHVGRR